MWTPTCRGSVTSFKAHSSAVRSVQFNQSGELLLSSSDDKSIKVWDVETTKFRASLAGHCNWVRSAKWCNRTSSSNTTSSHSATSSLIVSGGDDKTVRLWDLRAGQQHVSQFNECQAHVTDVAFHPSGYLVAASSADGSINIWDIRNSSLLQHYANAHGYLNNNPISTTTTTTHDTDTLYNGGAKRRAGMVYSIAFGGGKGEWLLSGGDDGLVKVWDLQEGHLFYSIHGHRSACTAVSFSPDSRSFASGGADLKLMLWRGGDLFASNNAPPVLVQPTQKTASNALIPPKARSFEVPKEQQHKTTTQQTLEQREPPTSDIINQNLQQQKPQSQKLPEQNTKSSPQPSPEVSNTLLKLVHQLDLLTQTMSIIEERLSGVENKVVVHLSSK